jgi:hypothetical protein
MHHSDDTVFNDDLTDVVAVSKFIYYKEALRWERRFCDRLKDFL